jgi:hypothetical protein
MIEEGGWGGCPGPLPQPQFFKAAPDFGLPTWSCFFPPLCFGPCRFFSLLILPKLPRKGSLGMTGGITVRRTSRRRPLRGTGRLE